MSNAVPEAVQALIDQRTAHLRVELEKLRSDAREYAAAKADSARTQALGILGGVALLLTIVGGLGFSTLVDSKAVNDEVAKLGGERIVKTIQEHEAAAEMSAAKAEARAEAIPLTVQAGTEVIGSFGENRAIGQPKEVEVRFPAPFRKPPVVVVSSMAQQGSKYPDTFTATVRGVSEKGFTVLVARLGLPGWGQDLRIGWVAAE
ncbi:MAG: hypothetical protein HY699_14415 [Deltaproteobacteria bacterium]|nr:hypothetical protein [Deltaproteobacteria bacterium]